MFVTISIKKRCSVCLFLQLFVGVCMSYLRCLCLFAYGVVQLILCCVFVLFVFVLCNQCCQFLWIVLFWLPLRYSLTFIFVLCLVYPVLQVSLDCPFWLPLRYSLTFIFVLCLVYPMLPVSLNCPFLIVPSVFSSVYFKCTCYILI